MKQEWNFEEDKWNENYNWFLIENGQIKYSFKNKREALLFQQSFMLQHMLLTDIDNITHLTMLDPNEFRCWAEKIQLNVHLTI